LQDYYNELAQLRAGKSSKSKLLLAKFKTRKSLDDWEVREGNYFSDSSFAPQYGKGIEAEFDFDDEGKAVFSGLLPFYIVCKVKKCSLLCYNNSRSKVETLLLQVLACCIVLSS
jgi:hypothetical protein